MMYSPALEDTFYLARDSHAFQKKCFQWKIRNLNLAVYMESELPRLKGLDKEMLYWLHQGKKFGGKILKGERNERGK